MKMNSEEELIPNCLLTKAPVYFLAKRSFGPFRSSWDQKLAQYLKDHGYEIVFRELPLGPAFFRRDLIQRLLLAGPCHLILSPALAAEMLSESDLVLQENLSLLRYLAPRDEESFKQIKVNLLNQLREAAEKEWSQIFASQPEFPLEPPARSC